MSIATPGRIFSPWARRTIAGFAIVFGLVLALAALDQVEIRKIAAALVCFAIAAANLLPPRPAKWFGISVAVVLVLFSGFFVARSLDGSMSERYAAVKVALLLGLPAVLYLVWGTRPFDLIASRRAKSPQRAREE
jgi:hypothetical protein